MARQPGLRQRQTGVAKREEEEYSPAVKAAALAAAVNVPRRNTSLSRMPPRLESFDNLPDYLRDNEFIVGSYRPEQSFWESIRTLFVVHNETGNVWSHFLGFFLFLGLAWYFYYHPPTPLAVTAEHVEALLVDMQHQLQSLHVGDNLQAFSHSLADRVHAIEQGLQDKVHAIEDKLMLSALSDNLHNIQDNLQAVGQAVGHRLQDNLHSWQDSLHNVERNWQHKAAGIGSNIASRAGVLQAALLQQLKPIVQWPVPRWPVYVYFAGAMVCLLTSGVCHLLGCCKRHIAEMVWRFDYAGIAVLIVCSFVPAMYYAFLCQPWWRNFYLLTTLSMGVVVVAMSLPTMFQARHYRGIRAGLFTMLGAWGVVPVTQLLLTNGHVWAIRRAFQLDLLMGAIYLCGAIIYACRVPERWYPGKFDIFGHSHQLWHAAVVMAAWVHYVAIMVLLQWRDASGGCAAPGSVNGPVHEVLGQMQQMGKAPLAIEQVYETMQQQVQEYVARRAML